MRKQIKTFTAMLLTLAAVFSVCAAIPVSAETDDTSITITLHAGEMGYFGDPSVKEKESVQRRGEPFREDTVPDSADPSYKFLGWSKEEGSDSADVFNDMTNSSMIGTDVYAVWSNEAAVEYDAVLGFFRLGMGTSTQRTVLSTIGSKFQELVPESYTDQLEFDGWYSDYDGKGTRYTEETVLDRTELKVYGYWKAVDSKIEAMEEDKAVPVNAESGGVYYSFTPQETALYEFSTSGADGSEDAVQAYMVLYDQDLQYIATADPVENSKDVVMGIELTAGKKYYVMMSDFIGSGISFSAVVTKPQDYVSVTFHTNFQDADKVYFDQKGTKSKDILLKRGTALGSYMQSAAGLIVDTEEFTFYGWADDKDADEPAHGMTAGEVTEVYAVYMDFNIITLDANGGYFPQLEGQKTHDLKYTEGDPFISFYSCAIDNDDLKFSGWATTPDAKVPNIVEGEVLFEELPDVIYAVYGQKLLLTFDANGGCFFLPDSDVTVYEITVGYGAKLGTVTVLPKADKTLRAIGWTYTDENGDSRVILDGYDTPRIYQNTVFKALWGKAIRFDANGGFFYSGGDERYLVFPVDAPFSSQGLEEPSTVAMKYLAGWATTPEAEEPDVIEGVTPVEGITEVFAVWKDDSYVIAEGAGSTWNRSSGDGLRFVVKRIGEDYDTYSAFAGAKVDGVQIYSDSFEIAEGSLILTLKKTYLATLSAGEHEIEFTFKPWYTTEETTVSCAFKVAVTEDRINPSTGVGGTAAVLMLIAAASLAFRKKKSL